MPETRRVLWQSKIGLISAPGWLSQKKTFVKHGLYSGADKSLARPGRKQATATAVLEFHISYS
jgi:hypothetical protein